MTAPPAIVEPAAAPRSSSPDDGLDWLVSPTRPEEFFAQYWDRRPLRIPRREPAYFRPLLSPRDMEFALQSAGAAPDGIEIFNDGQREQVCAGAEEAAAAPAAGASVRINNIQRFSPALSALCRGLEQRLSHPVAVNAYLSPPLARALNRHFDTHDVFVLQLRGSKRWRIFADPLTDPIERPPLLRSESPERSRRARGGSAAAEHRDAKREIMDEFVLDQGDTLYLPRGYFHEVWTDAAAPSWHLTVGVHSLTYLDLLTIVLRHASGSLDALRAPLPTGFATHAPATQEVRAKAQQILASLPTVAEPEAALAEIETIFRNSRRNAPLPCPPDLTEPATLDSWLRIRRPCFVAPGADPAAGKVRLRFLDLEVSLPSDFEPALRLLATGAAFTPRSLPGSISDEERLSLADKLIGDGLLGPA